MPLTGSSKGTGGTIRQKLELVSAAAHSVPGVAPYMDDVLGRALRLGSPGIIAYSAGERMGLRSRFLVLSFGCKTVLEIPAHDASLNLISILNSLGASGDPTEPRFCGVAGYIAYEAGRLLDGSMNQRPYAGAPLLRFVDVDACYVLDRLEQTASMAFRKRTLESRRRAFADWVSELSGISPETVITSARSSVGEPGNGELSREDYKGRVGEILSEIARGDYYECNYTQRFRIRSHATPREVGQLFLASNPAPHSAFMDFGDLAIISASPELFLRKAGDVIETRPIKGSAPRGITAESDSAQASRLAASVKDAAEHTMVIDVARNDLGRVCRFGTVETCDAFELETYAAIHHLVSTVKGVLCDGMGLGDIFAATFPAASITGAPKIKVTNAIARYEASPRGIYTGAIGHIEATGEFQFNVAIRTIVATRSGVDGWSYEIGSGGAIVADSGPDAEYDECKLKAAPALAAIAAAEGNAAD